MEITYIHHSGFLVETARFYYLFDYESGELPVLNPEKPIFVLSSHSHGDHYNPEIFHKLSPHPFHAILSHDITPPADVDALSVSPGMTCTLNPGQKLHTFRSTDQGVAFLVEEDGQLIYHAGDLHDWYWEGEPEDWNAQMTADYRTQMARLRDTLAGRTIDTAFLVLDPRQEDAYDRGLCYFLEQIPAKQVYPMHYWDNPGIIHTFLQAHPQYETQIQFTEMR